MSILVPLNSIDTLIPYLENGADEFYLGFYDEAWERAFGSEADLNRMSGFGREANAFSFEEALQVIGAIVCNGARAFITFNAAVYSEAQCVFIETTYFPLLKTAGVSGVILSGIDLLDAARRQELPCVASTMCGIFNADIARFYKERGVLRMILPRDLGIDEIASLIEEVDGVEYEVFLMRNGCIFSDSHCLGLHRKGNHSLCSTIRYACYEVVSSNLGSDALMSTLQNKAVYSDDFHQYACGLCALWRFDQLGVSSYKIVGRGDEAEQLCRDAALTAHNLGIAKQCSSEKEYLETMEKPSNFKTLCKDRLSCYYPDI